MTNHNQGKQSRISRYPLFFAILFIASLLILSVAGMCSAGEPVGIACYSVMSFGLLITLLVVCHTAKENQNESS